MAGSLINKNAKFGTLPVFLTAISTILGAVLFLRFGSAVGWLGFVGVFVIIIIGHMVTIPTAMAVAEIATNQKVQGGGAYYIISRSFGLTTGGAIGLALYLSQAISISFYVIALDDALFPVIKYVNGLDLGWLTITDYRFVRIPIMLILAALMLTKGANIGMKALYVVAGILFISLAFFFLGSPIKGATEEISFSFRNKQYFFPIFAIIFPAFTGLAAGLGLSGDLKDPKRSIPKGTLWATVIGMIIYILVALKLDVSACQKDLITDGLIMQRIALWGPIIPIGLGAAAISSALGSIMVAPRTLQAIGVDDILPNNFLNKWISKGKEKDNEPINASIITILIAFVFIAIAPGDIPEYFNKPYDPAHPGSSGIDFIGEIISMFFMVTYGAICTISLLEHFAADPSYRPTFRSKWYFSAVGAVLSLWAMFKMNQGYAAGALLAMIVVYYLLSTSNKERKGIGKLFKGVIFQLSRQLQVFAQRADKEDREVSWRPFVICISKDSFKRRSAFDLLRWISFKYGFGTYIHYIEGMLNEETNRESKESLTRLLHLAEGSRNKVYLDTIISPSYTSAIAQVIQLSGISGKGNNMILFEFSRTDSSSIDVALKNYPLLESTNFDVCVLNTSYKGFGYKQEVHIWITDKDYENANLMILLAYIVLGHPEWKKGVIKIFAVYPSAELEAQKKDLLKQIASGRLPVSPGNLELIPLDEISDVRSIINETSVDADLTIVGFRKSTIMKKGISTFDGYDPLGNVLFVSSNKENVIELD